MWQIGNPVYFWGLLGLLVPLIIHLYNRRKSKVKLMGSLRWLTEIRPAQWHFRHIHQWPLLLIRCLLVLVAVLLLVDLQRTVPPANPLKIHDLILIHPEAGDTTHFRQLAEDWESDSVKVHWLQPHLPTIHEPLVSSTKHNTWSLIAEADLRFQPERIQVIVPNRMDFFDAAIPSANNAPWPTQPFGSIQTAPDYPGYLASQPIFSTLPPINAAVSWELTEWKGDTIKLVDASESGNQQELIWYDSRPEKSEFSIQKGIENTVAGKPAVSWHQELQNILVKDPQLEYQVPVRLQDTLAILADPGTGLEREWLLLQNALQAMGEFHGIPLKWTENPMEAHWYFHLQKDSLRGISLDRSLSFAYQPGPSSQWLEPVSVNSVVIRKELATGNILEGGLLDEFRPYFLAFKYKDVAHPEVDFRQVEIMDITENRYPYKKAIAGREAAPEFRIWLSILLLVLIVIERLWPKGIK